MSWFIYITEGKTKSYDTGITKNLKNAIKEYKIPVKLVYWEEVSDKHLATKREKEIKGWRSDKKEKLIYAMRQKRVYSD